MPWVDYGGDAGPLGNGQVWQEDWQANPEQVTINGQSYDPRREYTTVIGNAKYGIKGSALIQAGGDAQAAIQIPGAVTSQEAYNPNDNFSGPLSGVQNFLAGDKGYLPILAAAGGLAYAGGGGAAPAAAAPAASGGATSVPSFYNAATGGFNPNLYAAAQGATTDVPVQDVLATSAGGAAGGGAGGGAMAQIAAAKDPIEAMNTAMTVTGAPTASAAAQSLGFESPEAMLGHFNPSWLSSQGALTAASGVGAATSIASLLKNAGVPLAIGAGSLLSANATKGAAQDQAQATRDAAAAQAAAQDKSIAELGRQFDLSRSDLAPARAAGDTALGQLTTGTAGPDAPLTRKFSISDFWNDPVVQASYQSGLDLGTKALKNAAPLTTGLDSGAALKELTKFGTDYTGNMASGSYGRFTGDQTNQFNKLAAIAGIGQNAVNTGVNAGTSTASNTANITNQGGINLSSLISGLGNATASARLAGSGAINNGLQSISNWWQSQNLLNRMFPGSTSMAGA